MKKIYLPQIAYTSDAHKIKIVYHHGLYTFKYYCGKKIVHTYSIKYIFFYYSVVLTKIYPRAEQLYKYSIFLNIINNYINIILLYIRTIIII